MSNDVNTEFRNDLKTEDRDELLYFILIFLLLFFDDRFIPLRQSISLRGGRRGDSKLLYFILIYLLLFY